MMIVSKYVTQKLIGLKKKSTYWQSSNVSLTYVLQKSTDQVDIKQIK